LEPLFVDTAFSLPLLEAPSLPDIRVDSDRWLAVQNEYLARWTQLWEAAAKGEPPEPGDKRFNTPAWRESPLHRFLADVYLLNAETVIKMADCIQGDARTRRKIRFAAEQMIDALSPANFLATNPDAQQKLISTKGESLTAGIANMLGDMMKGRISQTDESAFEVGKNVATTPGTVVYENDLMQLIQYEPLTKTVGSRPLIFVPPCINKYYILDLQPENSLVRYAVEEGNTVFVVSWVNAEERHAHYGWDDYVELGAVAALRVAREITGADRVNALGFCVGGTILSAALAVMQARKQDWVASLTLLTTLLDFKDVGILEVFVDEAQVKLREKTIGKNGLMPGRDLAAAFSSLRPNDLVWNYVVHNYLKGEKPPAFDLLYWNGDGTNLPGPMFCWYLRNTYLEDKLKVPNALNCNGVPVDLGRLQMPAFIYASREDHIVPWRAAYASTQLLKGKNRFVLGASGHIAGVINPAKKNKRSHWTNAKLPTDADAWMADATEHPGSWWTEWSQWLDGFKGEPKKAPAKAGNAKYKPIEPAPGRYVKVRVV
jgi:polyhydroxyalkanoate synthase